MEVEWNGGGRHGEEKKLPLELRRYSLREKNGRKRKEVQESNVILIPNYSARSTAIYLEGTQGGARAGVITRRDDVDGRTDAAPATGRHREEDFVRVPTISHT
jgi:hypothetical protein